MCAATVAVRCCGAPPVPGDTTDRGRRVADDDFPEGLVKLVLGEDDTPSPPVLDRAALERRLRYAKAQIDPLDRAHGNLAPKLKRHRVVIEIEDEGRRQIARVHFDWRVPDWWGLAA